MMKGKKEAEGIRRRDVLHLGGAAAVGMALAGVPRSVSAAVKNPKRDEAFMMFPGNYTWSAAARSAIAASIGGGGELGEIFKICSALQDRVGNGTAWFEEWNKMGEYVASLGEKAEPQGHPQTASAAYLRGAHYIQIGERLLQPRTEASQKAYARSVGFFKKGLPNVPFLACETVEVPFEKGQSLPAYFVKSRGPETFRWPTVVFFDGLDITKEIQFFRVPELAKRGLAILIVDGPGNGESIRFRNMFARYDSNVAGSACLDYLETRKDVDKDRIGVMGVSLGGYYAPRAAAFDKRYKACVSWGAIWDYHATWKGRVEKAFKTSLSVPGEHINWVLGVENVQEALTKLEDWKLKGVASKIECPYLLTHGELDAQIPMEDARNLFNEVGSKDKTFKVFTKEEGGAQHCQGDNLTIGIAYLADWLSDKLGSKKPS